MLYENNGDICGDNWDNIENDVYVSYNFYEDMYDYRLFNSFIGYNDDRGNCLINA